MSVGQAGAAARMWHEGAVMCYESFIAHIYVAYTHYKFYNEHFNSNVDISTVLQYYSTTVLQY